MNTINYREKLRTHFEVSNGNAPVKYAPITAGLNFYDYQVELETAYRKSKGFSNKVLITDKAIYEFALSLKK